MDAFERAKKIKLAIFDVDGVMTDGSLYLTDDGQEYKAFNSLDGHGMKMLNRSGVELGKHHNIALFDEIAVRMGGGRRRMSVGMTQKTLRTFRDEIKCRDASERPSARHKHVQNIARDQATTNEPDTKRIARRTLAGCPEMFRREHC